MKEETTSEKLILEAAEEEFLTKGYSGAKTTSIAKRAGVTHAMLHYYYRTKENLFQKVFQQKVQLIADSFQIIFDENLAFEDIIRIFIEKHFDFVMENPGLINFVYNEIRANNNNSSLLLDILGSKIKTVSKGFEKIIKSEISKGKIKAVKPIELLLNIVTLNLSVSILFSITGETILNQKAGNNKRLLKKKKEDNVQYILHTLKV